MTATFVGRNAEIIRDIAVASLVTHSHMMVVGKPGGGKTSMLRAIGEQVFDVLNGEFIFIRVDPSTPPDRIKGLPDFDMAMQGKYVLVTDNTAYDPRARCILLDELMRAMDMVFDPVLDVMDRQDTANPDTAPVIWATSNWMSVTERIEAMKDRFTFRVYLPDEAINIREAVRNQAHAIGGRLTVTNHLPTKSELLGIYASEPGDNAIDAMTRIIERIAEEASDSGKSGKPFEVNYRRIQQWQQVLFRYSFFLTGDPDFHSVPAKAIELLNYAYPCDSLAEQQEWQAVLKAIADPLETALAALKQAAFEKYREIVANSNLQNHEKALQMGRVVADRERDLWQAAEEMAEGHDANGRPIVSESTVERINNAITEIKRPYSRMINGKDPFSE